MQHPNEHTLELYVLGSASVAGRTQEIDHHLTQCIGCRETVERMTAFYREVKTRLAASPSQAEVQSHALEIQRRAAKVHSSRVPAVPLWPVTRFRRFQHLVRQHPVMAGGGTFAALAGLALLFNTTFTTLTRDKNPAYKQYNVAQGVIEIRNQRNEMLWQLPSSSLQASLDGENDSHAKQTIIADLDGDGENEVLTTLNVADEELPGALKIYNAEGCLLRRISFDTPFHYEEKSNYTFKFNPGAFVVRRNEEGAQEIFIAAANNGRSPGFIARLNSRGDQIGRYWHFGNLGIMYSADVNSDGKEEIVAVGINDVDDEKELSWPAIVVLDPSNIVSDKKSKTASRFSFPFSDAELYYVRLPLSDINVALKLNASVGSLDISRSDVFNFAVTGNASEDNFSFQFQYIFSRDMSPLEVKSSTASDRTHALLVQAGKLTGTIDKQYLENLRQGIRYWDGKEWRKEVVRVTAKPQLTIGK